MSDAFDRDRLDAVLASIGEHLVVEREAGIGEPPVRELRRGPGRLRVLAIAAAVLAAAAIGVLVVAPVRDAVADWLGLGSTRVERVAEDPAAAVDELPRLVTGLSVATEADAEAELGGPLPDVGSSSLGPPDQLGLPPEGGVLMAWSEGETTLWVHGASFRPGDLYRKLVGMDSTVQAVEQLGDGALLISGDHILETPHRRLAARTVLLWTLGSVEYRLESNLDPVRMVEIAREIT